MEDELAALGTPVGGGERDLDAELVRRSRLALADALGLRGEPRIKFPAALALLLPTDLRGPAQGNGEGFLQTLVAFDLTPDIADDPAEAGAQELDLPVHALELLGVGVAPGHHRRPSGEARIRLA